MFRIDAVSGARTLIERNPGGERGMARYFVDHDNRVRLGLHPTSDGGAEMMARGVDGRWARLFAVAPEDALSATPLGFAADGRSFLMLDSTGDRAALTRVDAATGAKTVIGESARADVSDVWLDPATHTPHAFAAEYLRPEWRALDPDAQADIDFLDRQLTGDFRVTSRSNDDARWIVVEAGPTTSARTYLYDRGDRAHRRLSLLFRDRPTLEQAPLQAMTPVEINARDGLTLVSYLTLPPGSDANGDGRPDQPEPLVLIPHDGPWLRNSYGFNALHQWLANRGYAVLSVNFRGSAGFGKAFLNAGNREWGGRMQDDLLDAVQWAIRSRIAQSDRIAIAGAGFGGYAALLALATSQQFRCGVEPGRAGKPQFDARHLAGPARPRAQSNLFSRRRSAHRGRPADAARPFALVARGANPLAAVTGARRPRRHRLARGSRSDRLRLARARHRADLCRLSR